MNVQINEVTKQDGYTYISLSCEKMSADVAVGPQGVQVVNKNASHRAWRGGGKQFSNFSEAKASYKSSAMRAMLESAEGLA
jgi:hypothetical protein